MNAAACELCPHRCGRRPGFCGALHTPRVFRWGPHFGEEPPVSGTHGSGCVFFSGCTMKCVYCQNSPWSRCGAGEDKSVEELKGIFRGLALTDRVENWNLVSPTPYLSFIADALTGLSAEGVHLPVVWNSSGYERVETLEEYSSLCDTALFDLRYSDDATAMKYSGVSDYVSASRAAVGWAYENCRGRAGLPGLIVRILVLPGHADEAVDNLRYLADELSSDIHVSVMSQYTPAYQALSMPPLDRPVTPEEYARVTEAAADFGFDNGWIQSHASADPGLALLGENMQPGPGTVK